MIFVSAKMDSSVVSLKFTLSCLQLLSGIYIDFLLTLGTHSNFVKLFAGLCLE